MSVVGMSCRFPGGLEGAAQFWVAECDAMASGYSTRGQGERAHRAELSRMPAEDAAAVAPPAAADSSSSLWMRATHGNTC